MHAVVTGDINGDGRADVVFAQTARNIQTGCNTSYYFALSTGTAFSTVTFITSRLGDCTGGCTLALGDVTGDGKADLIIGSSIYQSTGAGFTSIGTTGVSSGQIRLADINGDGKADLIAATSSCNIQTGCVSSITIRLSNGTSFPTQVSTLPIGAVDCRTACSFGKRTTEPHRIL